MSNSEPFDPQREAHLLSGFVDGELDARDEQRVRAHLAVSEESRREVERLRQLKDVTGALRLKPAPAEQWEGFWDGFYNRGERSLGWVLVTLGVLVVGIWGLFQLLQALARTDAFPLYVKGGIFALAAGLVVLLISVVRERVHKRGHTRYKDVVR